jgi:glycosyltransferase involved in cell wall biosynthesis
VSAARPGRKVAIVAACPFPTLQGSQLLIRRLARGLVERGHPVVVVTYADGLAYDGLEHGLGDVPVRRIPRLRGVRACGSGPRVGKLLLDALLLATLVRVLRDEDVDLMHAHNYEAAVVALVASRLTGVPLVYHSHNALAEELPTYFRSRTARGIARRLGAFVDREVPRRADHCIAISDELVHFLRARGVEPGAIRLIAPGGSPDEFPRRSPDEVAAIRRRFGFDERPLLLYTGNLDPYQNLELLLASAARVRAVVPSALLVIATHATPRDLPAAFRRPPGGVELISARDFATVRDLLQVADVALCPRREWSGFPMKLLNYMAAGKAVVVSAGSAKAVQHGVNGWVVGDGDAAAYADAILDLLADPGRRVALGAAARRTVEDEYGWDRVLDQVEASYRDVLERRSPTRGAEPEPVALWAGH